MAATAAVSEERIQTIIIVRHGVAVHNLRIGHNMMPNLADPAILDPPLVAMGERQAVEAGEKLRRWLLDHTRIGNTRIDLALSSPLTRCLQSTVAILGSQEQQDIVCLEDLREAYGVHFPDRRRNKSLLMEQWPNVQFDPEMSERDELWKQNERETLEHVQYRVTRFFHRLVQQFSQRDVCLIASHGLWIEACLKLYCPDALPNRERVHNCDMFGGECVSNQGTFVRLQNVRRIR